MSPGVLIDTLRGGKGFGKNKIHTDDAGFLFDYFI